MLMVYYGKAASTDANRARLVVPAYATCRINDEQTTQSVVVPVHHDELGSLYYYYHYHLLLL